MKFTCEKDDLVKCISVVQRAMPSRSTLSSLEGIYLEAADGMVNMRCSDMILTIDSHIQAAVERQGAIVMPGRLFSDLIRKLPGGQVCVDMDDAGTSVKISCGKAKMTLQGMHSSEYPDMDEAPKAKPLDIRQGDLKEMIGRTLFAVASDETKPILTGELIEISDGKFTVVALDGYRLAMRTQPLDGDVDDTSFVVPSKSLSEMAKLFEDDDSPARILIGGSNAVVDMGDTRISTRLLEGEYIKYKTIIPGERATRIRVDKTLLAESAERASLLAREGKNNLIKVNIDEETMAISANSEMGDVFEEIPIYMEGNQIRIAFNARYLTDVLHAIPDGEILMDFITNLSPCVVRPVEGDGFLYLVLPVRVYDN